MPLNPASPNLGTGPTNQQGPAPQTGSTTPTGQLIGPLPASTMPGQLAETIPVMANFQFLLNAINNIVVNPPGGGVGPAGPPGPPGPQGPQGTPGTGGAVSITAVTPIVVTPSPITGTGVVSHAASGVTPGTYGDASHYPVVTVEADGHTTAVSLQTVSAGGGLLKSQEFTSSGTWTPPAGVTGAWITMVGGGGGGATQASASGGGAGGAGELVENMLVPISGAVTVTIGAGGAGAIAASGSLPGANGTDTSFGPWIAKAGFGGVVSSPRSSGAGGGAHGAQSTVGNGQLGNAESPTYFGGSSGGGGGDTANAGFIGGGSGGFVIGGAGGALVTAQGGGGGGAGTLWGPGGAGGDGGTSGHNAPAGSYGAGGGGSGGITGTTGSGGNGLSGYVLVGWIS
jgi:hypothetical protein